MTAPGGELRVTFRYSVCIAGLANLCLQHAELSDVTANTVNIDRPKPSRAYVNDASAASRSSAESEPSLSSAGDAALQSVKLQGVRRTRIVISEKFMTIVAK
jgi:hypothetical protein